MSAEGAVVVQDCILQDNQSHGIHVRPTGEVTVTGTTIRRCYRHGMFVEGTASIGKGCSVTACARSGVYAEPSEEASSTGAVAAEERAEVVCKGNNTSTGPTYGNWTSSWSGTISGIAAEQINVVNV